MIRSFFERKLFQIVLIVVTKKACIKYAYQQIQNKMNYSKISILAISIALTFNSFSQIGGNQVYGNSNYSYNQNQNYNQVQKKTIFSTDSTLIISTNILLNKIADNYLVSVGLNQEAKTVIECNTLINSRIEGLKKDLIKLGVKEDDLYVDFISQTKVYDYDVSENESEQLESGFEIKKNIIIRINDIDKIDLLIEMCAKQEIYDIIKVDYVNNNINNTYGKMYDEALAFIESRKNLYLKSSSQKLTGDKRVTSDNFYSVYPKSQYKKYEAYESSSLTVQSKHYSDHYIRKEARKNKTFYYDGVPVSGFDKIINSSTPDIGIQYVLTITMVYSVSN